MSQFDLAAKRTWEAPAMIPRILFALAVAGRLHAQTSAEITGRVTDASRAVVPGAKVTAVNTDKRTERSTTRANSIRGIIAGASQVRFAARSNWLIIYT